jgi:MFS transporter, AAHS family, 4-hydroxybenzoate transporter
VMALVSDYSPAHRRATVIMLVAAANAAGATLGAVLAGQLLPLFGWRAIFYFGGIAPLVLAVLLCFYLQESISWLIVRKRAPQRVERLAACIGGEALNGLRLSAENEQGVDYRTFLTQYMKVPKNIVNTLAVMCVYFSVMFELFFISSWVTTVLVESGLPIRTAIHVSSLFQSGGFVGMMLIAFFAAGKDITRLFMTMLVCACAAIVLTSLALHAPPGIVSSMLFITGFILVPCLPGGSSIVGRTYPVAIRATAFGAAYAAGRLGSVFGPLFGQSLHGLGLSNQTVFMLSALPCLIAALAVAVVYRNTSRPEGSLVPAIK